MRCNYRHNMWCNCKKPVKKLKSYEEIMGLGSSQARIDELNTAPVDYYNKLSGEGHMSGNTLQGDGWVVREPEVEVRAMGEK